MRVTQVCQLCTQVRPYTWRQGDTVKTGVQNWPFLDTLRRELYKWFLFLPMNQKDLEITSVLHSPCLVTLEC